MNLFELGFFLVMVSAVILCSRELGRLVAIPEALAVPLIIGILVLLLRVLTRIRPRVLLYLSALLAAVSLVSMGLAKALDLRESIFMIPVSAGLTLIVIRGAVLAKRRRKAPDADNGVQE
ncbi:MAG TPA: hypothetical protein VKL40_03955 [Candidatus Angelobacter sp.]|nr:hypothetical protein [Candidatus Angelobacter sp.]